MTSLTTGCACPDDGSIEERWCERHQCRKPAHFRHLCRTRPEYFRAYEEGRGPGQGDTSATRKPRRAPIEGLLSELTERHKAILVKHNAGRFLRSPQAMQRVVELYCRPCPRFTGTGCAEFGCGQRERYLRRVLWSHFGCQFWQPLTIVLGVHRSLSSCVANMLRELGMFVGQPAPGGEDRALMNLCEELMPFPQVEKKGAFEERVRRIRRWTEEHCRRAKGRPMLAKYPHLCAMFGELKEAWPDLRIVHLARPLRESIDSLVDRQVTSPRWQVNRAQAERLQRHLYAEKQRIIADHPHLTLVVSRLLDDPEPELRRVVRFLSLRATAEQTASALGVVRRRLAVHTTAEPEWIRQTTVAIKTFERPKLCRQLIDSIRERYPGVHIIVADDSRRPVRWHDVEMLPLPYDTGLAAGRNRLVEQVDTPYVLLCDDDQVFTSATKIEVLHEVLLASGFDIIGGKTLCWKRRPPFFGHLVLEGDSLILRPGPRGQVNGRPRFDVIENFFLARTDALRRVAWDDRLKVGEHVDWAIRCWQAGLLVGAEFSVTVIDQSPERNYRTSEYARMRGRAGKFRLVALRDWAKRLGFRHFVSELYPPAGVRDLT